MDTPEVQTVDCLINYARNIHDDVSQKTPPVSPLLFRLRLPRNKRLAITGTDAHIRKDLLWPQLDGGDVLGLVGNLLLNFLSGCRISIFREPTTDGYAALNGLLRSCKSQGSWASSTYEVVVNTLVQLPLGGSALPQLLVSVVEAFPVFTKLGQTVRVDVLEPAPVIVCQHSCLSSFTAGVPDQGPDKRRTSAGYTLLPNDTKIYRPDVGIEACFQTYTLCAQRVTRRPSFMQSNSPRPGFSVLHCI